MSVSISPLARVDRGRRFYFLVCPFHLVLFFFSHSLSLFLRHWGKATLLVVCDSTCVSFSWPRSWPSTRTSSTSCASYIKVTYPRCFAFVFLVVFWLRFVPLVLSCSFSSSLFSLFALPPGANGQDTHCSQMIIIAIIGCTRLFFIGMSFRAKLLRTAPLSRLSPFHFPPQSHKVWAGLGSGRDGIMGGRC